MSRPVAYTLAEQRRDIILLLGSYGQWQSWKNKDKIEVITSRIIKYGFIEG